MIFGVHWNPMKTKYGGEYSITPAQYAARNGCSQSMKFFIENKIDINNTAEFAVYAGYENIIRILSEEKNLNSSAFISTISPTLYDTAVRFGHTEVVRELFSAGFELSLEKMKQLAFFAVRNDYASIIELFFEKGLSVDSLDEEGYSLAQRATVLNKTNIISILIKFNADFNYFYKDNPFIFCAKVGEFDIIKILIMKKIINLKEIGDELLRCSVMYGAINIIDLLINSGVKLKNINEYKFCVNKKQIREALISRDADTVSFKLIADPKSMLFKNKNLLSSDKLILPLP